MKEIQDFPGYYATEDGRIWSAAKGCKNPHGQWLKPRLTKKGYLRVNLSKDGRCLTRRLSRLIALTFIPNPDPKNLREVNHKNKIKADNRVTNLEWMTTLGNIKHRDSYRTVPYLSVTL